MSGYGKQIIVSAVIMGLIALSIGIGVYYLQQNLGNGSAIQVSSASSTSCYRIITSIQISTRVPASGIAYDQNSNMIYVATGSSIYAIQGSTNFVTQNISVGQEVDSLLLDPNNGILYAATNFGAFPPQPSSLIEINSSTDKILDEIPIRGHVESLASGSNLLYDAAANAVYLANSYNRTISVFDILSNAFVANIELGTNYPLGMVYDSGTGSIFITTINQVLEISGTTNSLLNRSFSVSTSSGATLLAPIAYDSSTGEIYISESVPTPANESNQYNIISLNDSTLNATSTIQIQAYPFSLAYNPSNHYVYSYGVYGSSSVSSTSSPTVLSIIDAETHSVVESFSTSGSFSLAEFAFDSLSQAMYFTANDLSSTNSTTLPFLSVYEISPSLPPTGGKVC